VCVFGGGGGVCVSVCVGGRGRAVMNVGHQGLYYRFLVRLCMCVYGCVNV